MHAKLLSSFCIFWLFEPAAVAVVVNVSSSAGFMEQPTSQYHHAIYGGSLDLAGDKKNWLMRGLFFERPRFSAQKFVDQDQGLFGLLGHKVTPAAEHGLLILAGYGRIFGYLKDTRPTSSERRVGYTMPGPVLGLEYFWNWRLLELGLNHYSFMGYSSQKHLEARVVWPYTMFTIRIGGRIPL